MRESLLSTILVFSLAVGANASEQLKFEPLYRAGKAIEGATASGVGFVKFSELTQAFTTELLVANDRAATDKERQIVALYATAAQAYVDSLTIWRANIQTSGAAEVLPNVQPLFKRYRLTDRVGNEATLQIIWSVAGKALKKADLGYAGGDDELAALIEHEKQAEAARHAAEEAAAGAPQAEKKAAAERAAAERSAAAERARAKEKRIAAHHEEKAHTKGFSSYAQLQAALARKEQARQKAERGEQERRERFEAERRRDAGQAEQQRQEAERLAAERALAEREARRPRPYEIIPGSWTCPAGYVIRQGKCYGENELPKFEMGR
jgi:hypothetical protein